jgi:hypothetical protein
MEFRQMEDCKFEDCNFKILSGGMNIVDCIGIEFDGCKWDMDYIANYGIQISNAKIRFQKCAMKFQSDSTSNITGINITASIIRINDLDLQISSSQLESSIVGILINESPSSKVWINAIYYQLYAPETEKYIGNIEK